MPFIEYCILFWRVEYGGRRSDSPFVCVGLMVRDDDDDEKRLSYDGSNLDARTT
jgi:hypothetical protein